MTRLIRNAVLGLTILFTGGVAAASDQGSQAAQGQSAQPSKAADSSETARVLGKLHESNVKEIRMGKMAEEHGRSAGVKAFGKTLVEDHNSADAKVAKLAKQENITLAAVTPAIPEEKEMPTGDGFDAAFSKSMLKDHQKDISEVKAARDATSDPKLKSLLGELLPVLEKHERTAQKLVDQGPKS